MNLVNGIDELFEVARLKVSDPKAIPSPAQHGARPLSEAARSRPCRAVSDESGKQSVVLELIGGELHGVTVDGKFFGLPTLVECRLLSLTDRMIVHQLGKRVAVLADKLSTFE